ncbi:MAG: radical SAM family heme chaperone HemW [Anaerolineae bacterium]|nr:radical SAM family heme chaperone HemW [Anaerolineae bacterium]
MDTAIVGEGHFRLTIQPKDYLSLYIHIPFCETMCSYCAFNTYTELEAIIPQFVEALIKEIHFVGASNPELPVGTIFFGGGTPSLLSVKQYKSIFDTLRDIFRIVNSAEISLESNPNDLTLEYLQDLRKIGFNRLSIGMQSANQQILTLFNRNHNIETVLQAITDAKKARFDNLSIDIIFGTPYQTLKDWEHTLNIVIDLGIQNVSSYNLILEGGTPLKAKIAQGTIPTPDDDLAADMYDLMTEKLNKAGFEQYEISNWAKPSFESLHNMQYWRNHQYLGLGSGAHGYAKGVRYIVMRSPQKYINALKSPNKKLDFPRTPAVSKAIHVTRNDEISETIMMGLRMVKEGIQRQIFQKRFDIDIVDLHTEAIKNIKIMVYCMSMIM